MQQSQNDSIEKTLLVELDEKKVKHVIFPTPDINYINTITNEALEATNYFPLLHLEQTDSEDSYLYSSSSDYSE